ncbi:MAG: hypothetical protein ACSLFQ_23440 [Thermoanaerobaculia bacterium]
MSQPFARLLRALATLPILTAVLVAIGPPAAAAPASASRAVWIWEPETFQMLDDAAYRARIIRFLRERSVDRVYLYADEYKGRNPIRETPALYRSLVSELRSCGIDTHALLGSYFLQTETYVLPEKRKAARAMLRRVLHYNDTSKSEERFTGAHFDIEPHMLDAWKTDRLGLSVLFLERLDEWMKIADDSGLEMSAAVPFWLDGYEVEWRGSLAPMNEHVQSTLDVAVLMDYRDTADGRDGILRHAENEIAWAAAHGKRVVIGLETGDSEPSKVTFLQEGNAALTREIAKVEKALAGNRAFAGFAIHHLDTWMKLRE